MILYPAIDIRGGRCVRLIEGDFARETAYDADPSTAARRWVSAGAEWLHVVDLDGAVEGTPVNREAVKRIRDAVPVPIQLGGGLRTLIDLEQTFAIGIDRAILGTVALTDPELVISAVARWGDRIAVALDAREGRLATDGWLGQTDTLAVDMAQTLANARVRHVIFTDISRDGGMSGPNLESLGQVVESVHANVIASGGISSVDDVTAVGAAGAAGAIIGRALYEGKIDLAEALTAVRQAKAPA